MDRITQLEKEVAGLRSGCPVNNDFVGRPSRRDRVIAKAERSFASGLDGCGYSGDEGELREWAVKQALIRAGLEREPYDP
jgi:hypothetical protein